MNPYQFNPFLPQTPVFSGPICVPNQAVPPPPQTFYPQSGPYYGPSLQLPMQQLPPVPIYVHGGSQNSFLPTAQNFSYPQLNPPPYPLIPPTTGVSQYQSSIYPMSTPQQQVATPRNWLSTADDFERQLHTVSDASEAELLHMRSAHIHRIASAMKKKFQPQSDSKSTSSVSRSSSSQETDALSSLSSSERSEKPISTSARSKRGPTSSAAPSKGSHSQNKRSEHSNMSQASSTVGRLDYRSDTNVSLFEFVANLSGWTSENVLQSIQSSTMPIVNTDLASKVLKYYLSPSKLYLALYLKPTATAEECMAFLQHINPVNAQFRFLPAPRVIGDSLATELYNQRVNGTADSISRSPANCQQYLRSNPSDPSRRLSSSSSPPTTTPAASGTMVGSGSGTTAPVREIVVVDDDTLSLNAAKFASLEDALRQSLAESASNREMIRYMTDAMRAQSEKIQELSSAMYHAGSSSSAASSQRSSSSVSSSTPGSRLTTPAKPPTDPNAPPTNLPATDSSSQSKLTSAPTLSSPDKAKAELLALLQAGDGDEHAGADILDTR